MPRRTILILLILIWAPCFAQVTTVLYDDVKLFYQACETDFRDDTGLGARRFARLMIFAERQRPLFVMRYKTSPT
jgi:hypothetical protein